WKNRLGNPVFHIHGGTPPEPETLEHHAPDAGGHAPKTQVSFSMLLNLAAVANSENPDVLWSFLQRYAPGVSAENHPRLAKLADYAVRYFRDFVKPQKQYRLADAVEADALRALDAALAGIESSGADVTPELVQEKIYDVGRSVPRYQDLKAKGATPERPGVSGDWFNAIYQILLGEARGPRFGSFAALYGVGNTRALIQKALSGALKAEHEAFLKQRAA
ncbi:MAG: lysine--tRNA ligase, partial [Beijerinckiaceae bacterium]